MRDRREQRFAVYGVAIADEAVLLVRINRGLDYEKGCWFLPGGGIEHGEDPHTALRREFAEETGTEIRVGPLLLAGSDHRPFRRQRGDIDFHLLFQIYRVTVIGGTLRDEANGDTAGPGWVPLDRLSSEPVLPLAAVALRWATGRDDIPEVPRPDGSRPWTPPRN